MGRLGATALGPGHTIEIGVTARAQDRYSPIYMTYIYIYMIYIYIYDYMSLLYDLCMIYIYIYIYYISNQLIRSIVNS